MGAHSPTLWPGRKVEAVRPSPNPIEYHNIGTDTTNNQVTAGNVRRFSSSRLRSDEAQVDEGLYFVADALGQGGSIEV